jgi:hypothetical protein
MAEKVGTTHEDTGAGRVAEFESEVTRLKLKGTNAEPERRLVLLGAVLMLVGVVLAIAGWISSNGTNNSLNQNTDLTMAVAGLAVTVVGGIIWLRHSLSRYGRYWLARYIYEQRQQTDRIVEAVGRGAGHSLVGPPDDSGTPDVATPLERSTVESR